MTNRRTNFIQILLTANHAPLIRCMIANHAIVCKIRLKFADFTQMIYLIVILFKSRAKIVALDAMLNSINPIYYNNEMRRISDSKGKLKLT